MPSSTHLRRYLRHGRLPELAAFDSVMRLGHFGDAAAELHIAQSTLSGHLRKLADALEVCLFESQGRRRVPTPAAHTLHDAVADILAALQRADLALQAMGATTSH